MAFTVCGLPLRIVRPALYAAALLTAAAGCAGDGDTPAGTPVPSAVTAANDPWATVQGSGDLRGIPYERQKTIDIQYKSIVAGEHRLDFLVEGKVVLDLKAKKDFEEIDVAIALSYLRATEKRVGLLINFNKPRLVDGVKRLQR